MAFDPKAFAKNSAPGPDHEKTAVDDDALFFRRNLARNVKKGLRCQLQYQGITGNQYIEISYYDPAKFPEKKYPLYPGHPPYLPSVQSVTVTNILADIQDTVQKISKIDYEKISEEIQAFLKSANSLINDQNLAETMKDLKDISTNLKLITNRLNKTLNAKKITEFSNKLDATLNNINKMVISTTTLVRYLEENPDSLLRGKSGKPVVKRKPGAR